MHRVSIFQSSLQLLVACDPSICIVTVVTGSVTNTRMWSAGINIHRYQITGDRVTAVQWSAVYVFTVSSIRHYTNTCNAMVTLEMVSSSIHQLHKILITKHESLVQIQFVKLLGID